MATDTSRPDQAERWNFGSSDDAPSLANLLLKVLSPLASLKLTVTLLAMGIFIVFAGTVAQIDKDIWEVMGEYFRTFVAWIDFQIFFPRSVRVPGGFYFPGGFSIGLAMLVNLAAAHGLRFKVQARGKRLAAGLAATTVGIGMTWLVIASGSSSEGLQAVPIVSWATLWIWCKLGLVGLWLAMAYGLLRLDRSRKLEFRVLGSATIGLAGLLGWLLFNSGDVVLGDSSMRILWQLIKGGLASLVLLAGCWLLFRKRAGIVLLHAGVALMMVNELVVYSLHVEGHMSIAEGETVNYVRDTRAVELAVVDHSDPENDFVVVVPERLLRSGSPIEHDDLPFDVEVVRYFENSNLRELKPAEANPATAGTGLKVAAEAARPSAGTDSSGKLDLAAAYVKFTPKQPGAPPLGTYLLAVSPSLTDGAEQVTVGNRTYDVSLRFKRDYKPYSVTLKDVRFDTYMGTQKARNYSSEVRLVDPDRHVDRDVKIWMNNPLRYAGETFYQSNFFNDPVSGGEITGLQVVTNTGWMIPYVGCMIVGVGMLAQFSIVLLRFLNRRASEQSVGNGKPRGAAPKSPARGAEARASGGSLVWCGRLFPLVAVLAFGAWLVGNSMPPRTSDDVPHLFEFSKLPLVYQGRVQPFDTLARNSLRALSDRETFVDAEGRSRPAVQWLLDTITHAPDAAEYKVVRIYNLGVLETLGLERREGYRYSLDELFANMQEFQRQADQARDVPVAELDIYQKKILELDGRLQIYRQLLTAFDQPEIRSAHAMEDFREILSKMQLQLPLAIPPMLPDEAWDPYAVAWAKAWVVTNLMQAKTQSEDPRLRVNPATVAFNRILVSYANHDVKEFNEAVSEYRQELVENPPHGWSPAKTDFETFFNHAAPFYHASVLYVFAFVLAALAWLGWSAPLNRAAFWLIALTFAVHTAALIARIYISGRPPVTNLYSAAVFIGWGCVALGLTLEVIYRLGVGNIIAAAAGFSTLLIAHFLAGGGDTFTVLEAVLDTQFWLATHVVVINLGYATTYVAGLLGLIYVLRGVLTPSLTKSAARDLARMIYGTLCFSIFFSFVGTVLGGLWADDSWGRFWGWDPKENGALIIVLWNALVLHARWDGMVKERGLAVLAIVGNITVSWSMFGVNELGVGMHSYGFTEGVTLTLVVFVAAQLAVVALGCVPRQLWWSARRQRTA
jgi:ABC-type transport system involved in cytochrome c biogenesis permease subunit